MVGHRGEEVAVEDHLAVVEVEATDLEMVIIFLKKNYVRETGFSRA